MKSYWLTKAPTGKVTALEYIRKSSFEQWKRSLSKPDQQWAEVNGFKASVGAFLVFSANGAVSRVVTVGPDQPDIWACAHFPSQLPQGIYRLTSPVGKPLNKEEISALALGWQLGTYRFSQFKGKKSEKKAAEFSSLMVPAIVKLSEIQPIAEAIFMVRNLVNRPANDLTPMALADAAIAVAKQHKANCKVIAGEALLKANYPLVHAVGRASDNQPCLVDIRWGKESAPRVTLVGKGICFDSGGLDIKPSSGMKLMKKDMGGAAHVLALAHIIMSLKVPVRLRVLIPAAENSVGSRAFRPMDIITSRKGITVEIGNTDAEGRLVLCDALTEADSEKPDLLIDCATLTGAARVALGTDIPAFFTPDDVLANAVQKYSDNQQDPLWRLPLWEGYRSMLKSDAADINSAPDGGYAGAITAALYLKEFVEYTKSWLHVDMMAWNTRSRPGRPVGGEAMGLRALTALLVSRYAKRR